MMDLGTLGGSISTATAINDSGQVIGYAQTATASHHAFIWDSSNGMRDIGTLGGSSYAYFINSSGQVAGYSLTSSGGHAFLWDITNGMRDLGSLGGNYSYPTAINSSGQVVGYSNTASNEMCAFLWDSTNGMRNLGNPGGKSATPNAINDSGQVVGSYMLASGYQRRAFLWDSTNGMRDLGSLGGAYSDATALNSSGQVVGVSSPASSYDHAFLWDSTKGMIDLNSLLSSNQSFFYLGYGWRITDLGLITGVGTIYGSYTYHAFLASPIPTANAGSDQTVSELTPVALDGSGSTSLTEGALTYTWTQVAGNTVSLDTTDPKHPTFKAPTVGTSGEVLTFQLVVSDGLQVSKPSTVNITVVYVNEPPVANAGANQTVNESSIVTMDGSGSYDPDHYPGSLSYSGSKQRGRRSLFPTARFKAPVLPLLRFTPGPLRSHSSSWYTTGRPIPPLRR
jgi:probable HAF family extracellular repeat protein